MRQALCALAATTLVVATDLAAQECIGLPLTNQQSALVGNLTIADQTTTVGGQLSFNVAGTLTLGGGAGIVMADAGNGLAVNGLVAIDMPVSGLNSCLVSGAQFTSFSISSVFTGFPGLDFEAKQSLWVVPVGFGIGTTIPASGSSTLILNGIPQLLLARSRVEADLPVPVPAPGIEFNRSKTKLAFGLSFGATLVSTRLFGGLSVGLSTLDESDTVFTISVGTVLGRR
ncbi:MAG: hypothetical protein ACREMA_01370 [Longimicrobiales bacterium]